MADFKSNSQKDFQFFKRQVQDFKDAGAGENLLRKLAEAHKLLANVSKVNQSAQNRAAEDILTQVESKIESVIGSTPTPTGSGPSTL